MRALVGYAGYTGYASCGEAGAHSNDASARRLAQIRLRRGQR
jgi:hypothetical protein